LYLPRAKAPAPELERSTDVPQVEGGPLRILLVEDNPQVADIAASLLNERGHTTIRVSNAHDALGLLSSGLTFDLVLTDLVMPGERDGIDLAHSVRERWPTLPVLLATGYSKAASRATGEGFTLLTKPYEPDALMVAIQQATTAGDASASS
jgi:CheY-like chemotaxis protein